MKKHVWISLAALLMSILLLAGCGASTGKTPSAPAEQPAAPAQQQTEAAPAPAATESPAPAPTEAPAPVPTEAPAPETAKPSPLIGNWMFYSMESSDPQMNVPHEALAGMLAQGFDYAGNQILTLYENASYALYQFGDVTYGSWTDMGDGTGTFYLEGAGYPMYIENGLLVINVPDQVGRFEPTDRPAA